MNENLILKKIFKKLKITEKLYIFIVIIFIFGIFYLYFLINRHTILNKYVLNIKKGFCELNDNNFSENIIIKLDGEWEFYWDKLLVLEDYDVDNLDKYYIYVPSYWQNNKDKNGNKFPDHGIASYRLIIDNKSKIRDIGISIRGLGGAYNFYINKKLVYKKGEINRNIKDAKLKFSSDLFFYSFPFNQNPENDKIEIIVEVQSEYYFKSGIYLPIEIGSSKVMLDKNTFQTASDLFIFGLVFIMGFYHLILYFLGYREKAYLYFGFFALVYSYRIISTGILIFNKIFPDLTINWDLRIYQIFLFLILPSFAGFIADIFNKYFNKFLRNIFVIFPSILALLNLFLPLAYIDYLLIIFEVFALLFMLYLIFILITSFINKYKYLSVFAFGVFLLILGTTHDILKDFGIGLKINMMPVVLASFIFIQSLILSIKFSDSYKETKNLSYELERLNQFFQKFVPQSFLDFIKNENIKDKIIEGENVQTKMGMMFIKIKNLNDIYSKYSNDISIKILNNYFDVWNKIARKNYGFIEKYEKEGILILFPTSPDILISCSYEIINDTNKYLVDQYKNELDFNVSIHYGDISIGTIGSNENYNERFVSKDLEYLKIMVYLNDSFSCKVLFSEKLYERINEDEQNRSRYIGNMKIEDEEINLYEYLGVLSEKEEYLRNFYKKELEELILFIINKKYIVASEILKKLLVKNNEDNILLYYKEYLKDKV
jgi:hypothetical protein